MEGCFGSHRDSFSGSAVLWMVCTFPDVVDTLIKQALGLKGKQFVKKY